MKSKKQKKEQACTSDEMIAKLFKNPEIRTGFIKSSLKAGDSPEKINESLGYYGYGL